MRTTIIAIILAGAICFPAFMLSHNPKVDALVERIERLELRMTRPENRFEANNSKIKEGFAELKELLNREYTHIIPVSGGFLGIKKDDFKSLDIKWKSGEYYILELHPYGERSFVFGLRKDGIVAWKYIEQE